MDEPRRVFFKGLAALLPTLVTIALVVWAYRFVNDTFGAYITRGMVFLCSMASGPPDPVFVDSEEDPLSFGKPIDEWHDRTGRRMTVEYKIIHNKTLERVDAKRFRGERDAALWRVAAAKYRLHLLGFLIAIILVYFVGYFLASFIGRTSWRMVESVLYRIPVIRAIYPNVKQVTDFLFSERKVEFSGVVAVQYPRKGIWSVGLTTGPPMRRVQVAVAKELITVFIPSSPTPITGYVIQVPREDVIELNMTIDEGLRFTISAGVIKPGAQLPVDAASGTG